MTNEEIVKAITENTTVLHEVKRKVNDHLHEHGKLRFWLFTFFISSHIALLGFIVGLIVKLL